MDFIRQRLTVKNLCVLAYLLQYHPDVSKDSQAEEVFKSIRQAYEVSSY